MVVVCALRDAREKDRVKEKAVVSLTNRQKALLGIKLQNVAFVFATFEETKT